MKVKLAIREEKFYNNGKLLIDSIALESGEKLEDKFREALNTNILLDSTTRRKKNKKCYKGVGADDLNAKIRECLKDISGINGETHVENGFFMGSSSKNGFDFSMYDKENNFSRLYNYYVGEQGILNGDEKINNLSDDARESLSKSEFAEKVEKVKISLGGYNRDYIVEKKSLSIVGEIQFGNWALAYRDIIKLLNANLNPGVDFYIYITATGDLKDMLSEGIVHYKKINDVIQENISLLQIPTWVIGLDICDVEEKDNNESEIK